MAFETLKKLTGYQKPQSSTTTSSTNSSATQKKTTHPTFWSKFLSALKAFFAGK